MQREDIFALNFEIKDDGHLYSKKNPNQPVHATESIKIQYRISQQLDWLIEKIDSLNFTSVPISDPVEEEDSAILTRSTSRAAEENDKTIKYTTEVALASPEEEMVADKVIDDPININTATKDQLIDRGVTEEKADSIIAAQPFGSQASFKRKFKSLELEDLVEKFIWESLR